MAYRYRSPDDFAERFSFIKDPSAVNDCPPGWTRLLWRTCMTIARARPPAGFALQVNTSLWGGLNLIDYDIPRKLLDVVRDAERSSAGLCAVCGKRALVREFPGLVPLCRAHGNEYITELVTKLDDTGREKLTHTQIRRLEALNARLAGMETDIVNAWMGMAEELPHHQWMNDHHADVRITFRLDEQDALYDDSGDNIIVQMTEGLPKSGVRTGLADGNDWNDRHVSEGLSGFRHCMLFHELYDHEHIPWSDILRIGSVTYEIKLYCQSGHYAVSNAPEKEDKHERTRYCTHVPESGSLGAGAGN